MIEKKDSASTIHMPESVKRKFERLASRKNMGVGEYILNELMIPHLNDLESELSVLREIFETTEN